MGENARTAPTTDVAPLIGSMIPVYPLTGPRQFDIMRSGPGLREQMQFKRRTFITLLGGAAAWPLATRAQQSPIPVIGFLSPASTPQHLVAILRQILAEAGYVEGRNLTIEYRFAEGQYDRLPALAAELVQRQAAALPVCTSSIPDLGQSNSGYCVSLFRAPRGSDCWSIPTTAMPRQS